MAKCAFCGNEINFGDRSISHCKGGCNRTLFLCKCGAANKPLASYCRHCGEKISFSDAERRFNRNLKITAAVPDQPMHELSLSRFAISQAADLSQLYFSYGYMLLLLRNGRIFIMGCGNGNVEEVFDLPGELNLSPVEFTANSTRAILIFTAGGIYKLDMIRDFHRERIFSTESDDIKIDRQPICIDDQLFLTLRDERQSDAQLRLVSLDRGNVPLLSLKGRVSQPVRSGSKIFFYTQEEVFVYDHAKRDFSYRDENRYGFDVGIEPKSDGSRVYVLGDENRIYRISLDAREPEIFGLPHPQVIQANFDVMNGQILISHTGGVLVTNVLGQVEWSSEQVFSVYPAYKFSPISFGNYLAFVMTHPQTEVLYIVERPKYKQIVSFLGSFIIKPVFYAGYLLSLIHI